MKKQAGMATLVLAVILLIAAMVMTIYATQHGVLQQKSAANQIQNSQAFQAAEAGLETGLAYLNQNISTVTGSQSGGYINYGLSDSNITNISLGNNCRYSVVYTNPTQNNYQLLQITSTGTNADGTSIKIVSQQVYSGMSNLKYSVTTQRNMTTSGTVNITGQYGADVGGTYTQSGNVSISQMTQNDTQLANMSGNALFTNIFGMNKTQMQSQSAYFANTNGINYNNLSGTVWINANVALSGNNTIGTQANPVLLIVNGNLTASGTVNFYGIIYVTGTTTTSGSFNVNGGLVSEGSIVMSGTSSTYNTQIVNQLAPGSYAKIPGSWKDF